MSGGTDVALLANPYLLRLLRSFCPSEGQGDIESIAFKAPGMEPLMLTHQTRKQIEARLRELTRVKPLVEQRSLLSEN